MPSVRNENGRKDRVIIGCIQIFWLVVSFCLHLLCLVVQNSAGQTRSMANTNCRARHCVHATRSSANTWEGICRVFDFEEEWPPEGHVTCSEVSSLFGWQRGQKNNNNNIKTGEDPNSGLSAVGNLSFHVKGNSTGLHAANFPLWAKTTHITTTQGARQQGELLLPASHGRKSIRCSEGKQRAPLWVIQKCVSEWGKSPLFLLSGTRGRYALRILLTRVLDPNVHPQHGN